MSTQLEVIEKKKLMLQYLSENLGFIRAACDRIGMSYNQFYVWKRTDPEFKSAVDEIEHRQIELVENELFKKIKGGDMTAIIFYLKTKGKSHGYSERIELEHSVKQYIVDIGGIQQKLNATESTNTEPEQNTSDDII